MTYTDSMTYDLLKDRTVYRETTDRFFADPEVTHWHRAIVRHAYRMARNAQYGTIFSARAEAFTAVIRLEAARSDERLARLLASTAA